MAERLIVASWQEDHIAMESDLTKIREVWRTPLTGEVNEQVRTRVLHAFPVLSSCGHDGYLALAKYLGGTPERFYSP